MDALEAARAAVQATEPEPIAEAPEAMEPEPEPEPQDEMMGKALVAGNPYISGTLRAIERHDDPSSYTVENEAGERFIVAGMDLQEAPEAMEEEEMGMTSVAPDQMAENAGLQPGATLAEVQAAMQGRIDALENAAKAAALTKAGCKSDLVALVGNSVQRGKDQNWDEAVAAVKPQFPSAFASAEPVPAPVEAVAPVATLPKLPSAVQMPDRTEEKAEVPLSSADEVAAFRDMLRGGPRA